MPQLDSRSSTVAGTTSPRSATTASAKELIAQIQSSSPEEDHFDARVKVLGEYIDHHVKEEEGQMFPKAKKAGLDAVALGTELSARKEELIAALSEEAAG